MQPTVLNPVRVLKVQGADVEVRELKALELLQFFKLLDAHLKKITGDGGGVKLDSTNLLPLVTAAEDLFTFAMLKSTRRDAEWLATVDLGEALEVLTAAWELNREVLEKKTPLLRGMRAAALGQTPPKSP